MSFNRLCHRQVQDDQGTVCALKKFKPGGGAVDSADSVGVFAQILQEVRAGCHVMLHQE